MLLTISEPTLLGCGDCESGHYAESGPDAATCVACGNTVTPSRDIERYLDRGEHMVTVDGLLAYFTEENVEEDGVDY